MEDELSLMGEKGKEVTQKQKELLLTRIKELKCLNAALLAENDMFERFISRIDPQGLVSLAEEDGLGAAGASQLEAEGRGRKQSSWSNISDKLHQLTLGQKLYVAQIEVSETQQDRDKLRRKYERIQDNYKASLKEAELRLEEIRRARSKFECRLLKPMKDKRLEIKEPKKVLQYIEDKTQSNLLVELDSTIFKKALPGTSVTQLERLNLKIHALRIQEKKLLQRLQHNIEMEKTEQEEIFQEYSEQINNMNLGELQVNNMKVQRLLRSHKEKLMSMTLKSKELSNEISNRKQMLAKIEEELQHAEEERLKAEALNKHLRRQMADYQAPDIAEYMFVKDKHKRLQRSIHTLERKVEIAQMALKTQTKTWSTQRITRPPACSAEAGIRSREHQTPINLPYIAEHSS